MKSWAGLTKLVALQNFGLCATQDDQDRSKTPL